MSSVSVRNLSIKFRSYSDRTPTLKNYLSQLLMSSRGQLHKDFFAIRDVSMEAESGDRIGIIGRNGSGKSTFLKALCGIYAPYEGSVSIEGRIAPLLEIGAGFHPEFSGRENIYLNGAILRYSRRELKDIEHEVITFAGLEDFIDTPVKYYSTGMYMRLAFSLSTAMQPDILILDEIFNGGDSSFAIKAKSRLETLIGGSEIMIMVSHDLDLTKELCNRVLWIDSGAIVMDADPQTVINAYGRANST